MVSGKAAQTPNSVDLYGSLHNAIRFTKILHYSINLNDTDFDKYVAGGDATTIATH
ncbi:hypothetical protein OK016_22625 [Vibrio chagasii]|nr:hypothetical protein [Vibrio chagasii]